MAAGATYVPIATQTLGSSASSVTFSSIPSTYTDLILISFIRGTYTGGGSVTGLVYVNNDTSALYSFTTLTGNGSSASSSRSTATNFGRIGEIDSANSTSGEYSAVITNFMNYANTSTYKTFLSRNNAASIYTQAWVNLYQSTSAINRIDIQCSAANIAAGSTFTLFGIAAA
jgi:hypothetical protein